MQIIGNNFLLEIIRTSPIGICLLDAATLVIEMNNEPYLAVAGKTYDQTIGHYFWDVFPEVRRMFEDDMNRALAGGSVRGKEIEVPLIRFGRLENIVISFEYSPVKNAAGEVVKIVVWVLEYTNEVRQRQNVENLNQELKATNEELITANEELGATNEELIAIQHELHEANTTLERRTRELVESEVRFRSMVENSPAAMLIFRGEDLVFETVNDAMLQILDKGRDIIGKPLLEGLPEVAGQPVVEVIRAVYRTGVPFTTEGIRVDLFRNGKLETGYFNGTYRPLYEDGRITGILQVAVEVTGLFNAHHALQESEARFRTMAEGTDVMIAVGDETGKAIYFNKVWEKVTGRSMEDLMQFGWVDLMHPDDKERVMKTFTDAFQTQAPWSWEFRMPDHQGSYRWLLSRGIPRLREDGSFAGYISSSVDITERKEDEQRKNDFISMVSHELKTPLTSMNGYIQMLQIKARKNEDSFTANTLEKANKQVGKMTTLINGFLNVSRLESGKIHIDQKRFDIAQLIKETEEESIASISSHKIVFAPAVETWVNADRDKIGQVINNLVSNAVKYSPLNSTITVACVTRDGNALVSVKDGGMGISPQDLPKLFERYYRVTAVKETNVAGFGIGLYLCCEIIKRHGGNIWAESEVGKGSTFYFTLPVVT